MGVLSPGSWNAREFLAPGNINWQELSQRSPSQLQHRAPRNCLKAPVLNTKCQTTSKTGTQTHPSAVRLLKVILSPQTPQNKPPDAALPIRWKRSSYTHQNAGTSSSHQEAYTSHWTNLTQWGQKPEARGNTTLQPVERRPQTQ